MQVNQSFKGVHDDSSLWNKYGKLLEKNYTIEDFRPHFVRSFINVGVPLTFDISNYTESFNEMEEEIYQYHKEIRDIVGRVN